jgi:hypothetical protein
LNGRSRAGFGSVIADILLPLALNPVYLAELLLWKRT